MYRCHWAALWDNVRRSLRGIPPPNLVGEDHLGNKYFEFIPTHEYSHLRKKRSVKPVDTSVDYELPFEWESWLRGRRRDPPTPEEIQERIARQAQAVANARKIDEANGIKPAVIKKKPNAFPKLEGFPSQAGGPTIRLRDTIDE